MFSKAQYFSTLLKDTPPHTTLLKNILIFDNVDTINFIPLDSLISETLLLQEQPNRVFDFYAITNAAILYAVAQREGKVVGIDDFNGEQIITALMNYMNSAIENKKEVAYEIYQCWQALSQKLALLNLSSGANETNQQLAAPSNSSLPPLQIISDFPNLVHKTAFHLLSHFARQIEEDKKQDKKSSNIKKNAKEPNLYVTYEQWPKDDELKINDFYLYIQDNVPHYAVKNEQGEVKREAIYSKYTELNTEIIQILHNPPAGLSKTQKKMFFSTVAKNHPDLQYSNTDVYIATNAAFSSLIQQLQCLTGNYFGKNIHTDMSVLKLLLQLDCYIDTYFTHFDVTQRSVLTELQLQIQKEVVLLTGQWMSSLKDYIEFELNSAVDNESRCVPKTIKIPLEIAISNLLLGDFDAYSNNASVVEYLSEVCKVLKLDQQIVLSFIQRDQNKDRITFHAFKLGAIYALRQAAKNIELRLDPRAILELEPKQYIYSHLTSATNQHVEPFSINLHNTDLFEHTLLQLAGISEFPTLCRFYPNKESLKKSYFDYYDTNFFIELNLSISNMEKLTNYLKTHYGDHAAELIPSGGKQFGCPYIKVHLPTMMTKILPDWQREMVNTLLTKQRSLHAYQVASSLGQSAISLDTIFQLIKNLGEPYKLTNQSHFLEALLLRAFNINKTPNNASIIQSDNRVDSILDIDFLMIISEETAVDLVRAINQKFPEAARVIRTNIPDERINDMVHQQISIDKTIFISTSFQKLLSETLAYLAKNDVDFIKSNQIKSGTYQEKPLQKQGNTVSPLSKNSIFTKQTEKDEQANSNKEAHKEKCTIM